MIDTSKIRPGDTGTIRVTFEALASDAVKVRFVVAGLHDLTAHRVPFGFIASHTPAPWVPGKGDVVSWNGKTGGPNEWEVLAVNGRYAWVGLVGDPDTNFPCLHCNLTLIRKGAA